MTPDEYESMTDEQRETWLAEGDLSQAIAAASMLLCRPVTRAEVVILIRAQHALHEIEREGN